MIEYLNVDIANSSEHATVISRPNKENSYSRQRPRPSTSILTCRQQKEGERQRIVKLYIEESGVKCRERREL